jgi:hypothetical protein
MDTFHETERFFVPPPQILTSTVVASIGMVGPSEGRVLLNWYTRLKLLEFLRQLKLRACSTVEKNRKWMSHLK